MTTTTRTARPVFAARLDSTTGEVCEGFERLAGTATTKDEAIECARAAGLVVVLEGGLVEVTPAEVLGTDEDAWTVTVTDGAPSITVCTSRDEIDPQGLGSDEEADACAAAIVDAVRAEWPTAEIREVRSPARTGGVDGRGADISAEVRAVVQTAFDAWCAD